MKTIVVGILLILFCTVANAAMFKLGSVCPPAELPNPWTISDEAPDFAHNTPHFHASFSALGFKPPDLGKNSDDIFVSLRICLPASNPAHSLTPCGENESMHDATNRGSGFNMARRTVSGLQIGYRYFWPQDRRYVGICDGIDFDSMKTHPKSLCRIWIADKSGKRGLYIVVPGQAFRLIPQVVSRAMVFLDPRFARCTI